MNNQFKTFSDGELVGKRSEQLRNIKALTTHLNGFQDMEAAIAAMLLSEDSLQEFARLLQDDPEVARLYFNSSMAVFRGCQVLQEIADEMDRRAAKN